MTENLGMCVATGPAPVPVNQRSAEHVATALRRLWLSRSRIRFR
jgi:hypothetical protein